MNAGDVFKACKSNAKLIVAIQLTRHGKRVRNTLIIYLGDENNSAKAEIILDISEGAYAILT